MSVEDHKKVQDLNELVDLAIQEVKSTEAYRKTIADAAATLDRIEVVSAVPVGAGKTYHCKIRLVNKQSQHVSIPEHYIDYANKQNKRAPVELIQNELCRAVGLYSAEGRFKTLVKKLVVKKSNGAVKEDSLYPTLRVTEDALTAVSPTFGLTVSKIWNTILTAHKSGGHIILANKAEVRKAAKEFREAARKAFVVGLSDETIQKILEEAKVEAVLRS